jgi:hypothetical protein
MTLPLQKTDFVVSPKGKEAVSPAQSLDYMGDMLENMRKIARAQGLDVLAHMLELTRMEARLAARDQTLPNSPVRPR